MTGKERILTALVKQLATTQLLKGGHRGGWSSDFYKERLGTGHESEYVHFAYWDKPNPGDLVLAKTGGVNEWSIGWYVEKIQGDYGGAVIRELETGKLCNYGNEEFVPIRGLHKSELLENKQYDFVQKVLQAFRKGDEYCYRYGGTDFEGEEAVVWIREVFGGALSKGSQGSKPFSVRVPFASLISVKSILAALRAGGYGTKKFERNAAEMPTE